MSSRQKSVGKTDSTTARIHSLMSGRAAGLLVFANITAVFLAVTSWCFAVDAAYLNNYNPFFVVKNAVRYAAMSGGKLIYTVSATGRDPLATDATIPALVLFFSFLLLIGLEVIASSLINYFSYNSIRRQLEPLYTLARTAQRLSDEDFGSPTAALISGAPSNMAAGGSHKAQTVPSKTQNIDAERVHTLESALEEFRPEKQDAVLRTGDRDLKGLEDAINNLIVRTRDSYSQQIRFVSDASHELRTPIAVIKGYTDMLDRWGKEDEKILSESIEAIKVETDHMNRLVEQLLFLARGDSGRQRLTFKLFSLSDMAKEVYDESLMIDPSHHWHLSNKENIMAYGDEAMLKQSVRILVDNASKYTPEGETVKLSVETDEEGAPTISVSDEGVGISESDMSHLFERFYRSDASRSRHQGGTGLGLAIAKWIVDRHDGYFDIISREGIGSRFTIHLHKVSDATLQIETPQQ